jgi:thioesterase domain-containing protein
MLPAAITKYLRSQIPLTAAMEISAAASDGKSLTITAPLPPNRNHTDTAFGGSLSTLGIVAGWTLLHVALDDAKISAKLLIQCSATEFLRPADADLSATCEFPDAESLKTFLTAVTSRRRGKIELTAKIHSGKTLVATHKGTYVAILY